MTLVQLLASREAEYASRKAAFVDSRLPMMPSRSAFSVSSTVDASSRPAPANSRRPRTGAATAVLLGAAMLWSVCPAKAEYRVQAGDVLEVSLAGVPELRQRVPVQTDGTIMLPLVGTLMVEGAPWSDVRSRIQVVVASKLFRFRTPDGRELQRSFDPEEVTATIVEYKPVFVTGGVARPGEQLFRARMTVRQAIASAGGFPVPTGANATLFEALNLRSEYVTVWSSLAREQARVWRIKAELGERSEFDRSGIPPAPDQDVNISQILDLEIQHQKGRARDHEKAKEYLRKSIQMADEQIKVLTEQKQKEDEGVLADTRDLQRFIELYGQGALVNVRVTDARRALLLSSTRQLQTAAKIMDVKKLRSESVRDLEKIDDERQTRLLAELQDAGAKLTSDRAKLQSVREKLQLAGMKPPGSSEGSETADVIVFRRSANGRERFRAEPDTELQPGDVVEVGSRSEGLGQDVASR
jgi:polysaccharide biosynthesis/export protein